jgi:hypothetical protein
MEVIAISFIILFGGSYGVGSILLERKQVDDLK